MSCLSLLVTFFLLFLFQSSGVTALMVAAKEGHWEVVKALFAANAAVNAASHVGTSASIAILRWTTEILASNRVRCIIYRATISYRL